jgi:hypothetical protein
MGSGLGGNVGIDNKGVDMIWCPARCVSYRNVDEYILLLADNEGNKRGLQDK